MLPKVATTILHSTSRAAAAVQGQSHTFRNVLQLQTQSSPSSGPSKTGPGFSGSNYFSHNGTGGYKQNAGSRFQSGYHGASRAVTQANTALAEDVSQLQTDDNYDEYSSSTKHVSLYTPRKQRMRSHSLHISGRNERAEHFGVLRTVQMHTRSRQHVFALVDPPVSALEPAPMTLTRRSSSTAPLSTDASLPAPPSPPLLSADLSSLSPLDPAAPQTVEPPSIPEQNRFSEHHDDLERPSAPRSTDVKFYPAIYQNMMGQAKDIKRTEEIFKDFCDASANGNINWLTEELGTSAASAQLAPWNLMITAYFKAGMPDKAIGIVDQMMNSTRPALPGETDEGKITFATMAKFDPSRPPAPAPSTYNAIITGFCNDGDVETALTWFNRLLEMSHRAGAPHEPVLSPTRPDASTWRSMITSLAQLGHVDDANRLLTQFKDMGLGKKDEITFRREDLLTLYQANIKKVRSTSDKEAALGYLKFMIHELLGYMVNVQGAMQHVAIFDAFMGLGEPLEALETLHRCSVHISQLPVAHDREFFVQLMHEPVKRVLEQALPLMTSFGDVVQALLLANLAEVAPEPKHSLFALQAYARANAAGMFEKEPLTVELWSLVLEHAMAMEVVEEHVVRDIIPEYAFAGLMDMLVDLKERQPMVKFASVDSAKNGLFIRVLDTLIQRHGADTVKQFADERLQDTYATELMSQRVSQLSRTISEDEATTSVSETMSTVSTAPTSPITDRSPISPVVPPATSTPDHKLSREIEMYIQKKVTSSSHPATAIPEMMRLFDEGLKRGKHPHPYVLSKICQSLGKAGCTDEAKRVYSIAQTILAGMEHNKKLQFESWFQIEDGMVIALAQANDYDGAHLHRQRMLDMGGAPSADAYGGLILLVKDTTDDTSNALALYQESQILGVVPNQYLYNNIISKLAKARKADFALSLFTEMKSRKIIPTSITYGAVIGACARVGDVDSAERLFVEMVSQRNFKPRVPPFNTMMQLYTTTKPNRERALFFYEEMLKFDVKPTAYTYKLLMDVYALDPIDIKKVSEVFQTIVDRKDVQLQGIHFASLINAFGCVAKNLDAAVRVFNSIPSYTNAPPLEPVVVEAMLNVCVAHRRTDLMQEFVHKMNVEGVHMTAYIANVLIKGYAAVGELESARELFEGMVDPEQGMAALHNHAPHDPVTLPAVHPAEPVYREPSTWEVMVRAELGAGHRDRAIVLLERLKARQYPEAVYNRISGIMVDHSILPPWQHQSL